uniref:Family with sequence similarity 107 member A n=1 Tax=Hucho hucho TaxID=62062 RepID=A0A4W5KNA3_9TELE
MISSKKLTLSLSPSLSPCWPAVGPRWRSQEEEGVSDMIIQLKKPLNLVRVSKSHQELHRELRMTHKRGLEGKPELQHVLEQRNWEQGMKQRREAEEENKNRFPLQLELLKRHQRLEEVELKAQKQGLQSSSEFIRVKDRHVFIWPLKNIFTCSN